MSGVSGRDVATAGGAASGSAGDVERARGLVASAGRVTGAGISTDSGIPDFRGPRGVWTQNPGAEKVSDINHYLDSAEVRRRSWLGFLRAPAHRAVPNAGHRSLLALERRGALELVVTQNTDGLHLAAGHHPSLVVEIHGSSRTTTCRSCGARRPTAEVLERVAAGEDEPRCTEGIGRPCGGILKRDTVLFGEPLPAEGLHRAAAAARSCDLLLAVGTSLSVHPVAGLVPLAARRGTPVVIVNASATALDGAAAVVVRAPIGDALPAILEASGSGPS